MSPFGIIGTVWIAASTIALAQGPLPRITTLAGTGTPGLAGNDGAASLAQLDMASGVAVDAADNVYIADTWNHCVRRVAADGMIRAIAGTGAAGFSGDGGPAEAARLFLPRGLAFDSRGNLYIADSGNARVRKVDQDGNISTVAGSSTRGFAGDGGQAVYAQLNDPRSLVFDPAGNLYVADSGNFRIRRITPSGTITTVAGNGEYGPPLDRVAAIKSTLGMVQGMAFDGRGDLYFSDGFRHAVAKLSADDGLFHIVGGGGFGAGGDLGPASGAQFAFPKGVATDPAGNVYVADALNHRVRRIAPDGTVYTVAGMGGQGATGDRGPAVAAGLNAPYDLAFDSMGNLYIADSWNSRIRKIHSLAAPSAPLAISADPNPIPVSSPSVPGQTTVSWNAPGYERTEVHVNKPDGPKLAGGGSSGDARTGVWVTNGTPFFLVAPDTGKTLASVTVFVSGGISINAIPNPILVPEGTYRAQTTITWSAPGYDKVEIHVNTPTGPKLVSGGWTGSGQTGLWVSDGTVFYLVDGATGKTLATVAVRLQVR